MNEIAYQSTAVDRRGPPGAFFTEDRYLGYREGDARETLRPLFPPDAAAGASTRRTRTSCRSHVDRECGPGGRCRSPDVTEAIVWRLETGYGVGADGTACVACLTDMPGVAPLMWQWWFGWHLAESARYKLWHPGAHVFAAPGRPVTEPESAGGAAAYIGNVSYIDEYIGTRLMRLAVRFVPPAVLGFAEASAECVTIVGRGGPSLAPVTAVWLIHQIRRTAGGSEMRSRFYIGPPLPLEGVAPVRSAAPGPVQAEPSPTDLLEHCGVEMNHLASFLPELHREFSDVRRRDGRPRRN